LEDTCGLLLIYDILQRFAAVFYLLWLYCLRPTFATIDRFIGLFSFFESYFTDVVKELEEFHGGLDNDQTYLGTAIIIAHQVPCKYG